MQALAEDVWLLSGPPAHASNVYVIGDVLVDTGTVLSRRRILRQVGDRRLRAHALTHASFDRYGASHAICRRLKIPLWCGAGDAMAVRSGRMSAGRRTLRVASPHPVDRPLAEGDKVGGGFVALETPGHTPGHLSYWREADRVLLCGDVMMGHNPFLLAGGVQEPPPFVSVDAEQNRRSARRLASLEPELVCFGHGPPVRDGERFAAAVRRLAA